MHTKKAFGKRVFQAYEELFWVFFLGSILGFLIEGIWNIILVGEWVDHSATVVGPFCIVYGVGAVAAFPDSTVWVFSTVPSQSLKVTVYLLVVAVNFAL